MVLWDRQNLQLWQTEAQPQHPTRGSWHLFRHWTQLSSWAQSSQRLEERLGSSEDPSSITTTQPYCESCSCVFPRWKGNPAHCDFSWLLPLRERLDLESQNASCHGFTCQTSFWPHSNTRTSFVFAVGIMKLKHILWTWPPFLSD